jgi:DNA-3-methyladenine glycosylase
MIKNFDRKFWLKDSHFIAKNLLGTEFCFFDKKSIITELEVYQGFEDEASHAYLKKTKRNQIMFEEGGVFYVYLVYGMHYCLNFVTEKKGFPSAILIRSIIPLENNKKELNGPGKLTKYLGIDKNFNGMNFLKNPKISFNPNITDKKIIKTPRIGIKKGKDKLWRYLLDNFDFCK